MTRLGLVPHSWRNKDHDLKRLRGTLIMVEPTYVMMESTVQANAPLTRSFIEEMSNVNSDLHHPGD